MNKRNLSYCLRTACRLFTLGRKEREEKKESVELQGMEMWGLELVFKTSLKTCAALHFVIITICAYSFRSFLFVFISRNTCLHSIFLVFGTIYEPMRWDENNAVVSMFSSKNCLHHEIFGLHLPGDFGHSFFIGKSLSTYMGDFFLPQTGFCFDIQLKKQFSAFFVIN